MEATSYIYHSIHTNALTIISAVRFCYRPNSQLWSRILCITTITWTHYEMLIHNYTMYLIMCWKEVGLIANFHLKTHWGQVTHICVGKLITIASDNGLSPGRRQAIIQTNTGILLIGPIGTNFSEILSKIHIFSFKEMHLKPSSAKWRPFCLGLNVLRNHCHSIKTI